MRISLDDRRHAANIDKERVRTLSARRKTYKRTLRELKDGTRLSDMDLTLESKLKLITEYSGRVREITKSIVFWKSRLPWSSSLMRGRGMLGELHMNGNK